MNMPTCRDIGRQHHFCPGPQQNYSLDQAWYEEEEARCSCPPENFLWYCLYQAQNCSNPPPVIVLGQSNCLGNRINSISWSLLSYSYRSWGHHRDFAGTDCTWQIPKGSSYCHDSLRWTGRQMRMLKYVFLLCRSTAFRLHLGEVMKRHRFKGLFGNQRKVKKLDICSSTTCFRCQRMK